MLALKVLLEGFWIRHLGLQEGGTEILQTKLQEYYHLIISKKPERFHADILKKMS